MQSAYAILSRVACPDGNNFPHYLKNGTSFEKKKNLLNIIMCVSIFSQILPVTFHTARRTERDMIMNV
jgi:hypothetical protein